MSGSLDDRVALVAALKARFKREKVRILWRGDAVLQFVAEKIADGESMSEFARKCVEARMREEKAWITLGPRVPGVPDAPEGDEEEQPKRKR